MQKLRKNTSVDLSGLSEEEKLILLKSLRENVDDIDKRIVRRLNKRAVYSVLIGRLKNSLNLPRYNSSREKEILSRLDAYRKEPLSKEALLRIYERILDESRAIQKDEEEKKRKFNVNDKFYFNKFITLLSRKDWIVVLSSFVFFTVILFYTFFTPNYYKGQAPRRFEIKKGETVTKIVDRLYTQGIIPGKLSMRIAIFIYGAESKIKAARFTIPNGLNYLDLVKLLANGPADYLRIVTIHPGASDKWIAAKLRQSALIDSAKFIEFIQDKRFISSIGLNSNSLTGYLLPQKYEVYERSSAEEIITKFVEAFNNFMNDSLKQKIKKLKLTLPEVITLASIVEAETNKVEEMPKIAATYLNRLKIGMPLQADPTIQYILPGGWKRLLYDDLKIDSPYNTYKYKGLPPGPINNPGKDAILSVIYPANVNYLYFVADGNGGHLFSSTYNQHLKLVRKYKEWLKSGKK